MFFVCVCMEYVVSTLTCNNSNSKHHSTLVLFVFGCCVFFNFKIWFQTVIKLHKHFQEKKENLPSNVTRQLSKPKRKDKRENLCGLEVKCYACSFSTVRQCFSSDL